MTDQTLQAVFGLAAPIMLVLVILAPGRRRSEESVRHAWRCSLAIGLPGVVAFVGLYGLPGEKWERLLYIAVAGPAAAMAAALLPRRAFPVALGTLGASVAVTLILRPVWVDSDPAFYRIAPGVIVLVTVALLEPVASRRSGAAVPLALGLSAFTTGAVILLSGFLKLAVPTVAVGIGACTCAVVSLWARPLFLRRGAVLAVVPFVVCAAFVGEAYASGPIPLAAFLIPACAPLVLLLAEIRMPRATWKATSIRVTLVGLVCAAGVGLAAFSDKPEEEDDLTDLYGHP